MEEQLLRAAAVLRRGGVIAYPTEAVFGLGCDPHNEAACARILDLKQRSVSQGLLLIAADFAQVSPYIDLDATPATAIDQAQATWPGPQTWIFPRSHAVPAWIAGDHAGIGLRVTAHPLASQLCHRFGAALVSTSANRHGMQPACSAVEVYSAFGDNIDMIVDGALGELERATPIRDALSGATLRF